MTNDQRTQETTIDAASRLAEFESVCADLWPFVRYFALAGAHPDAITAVVRLGRLLGHTDASKATQMEIADNVRRQTVDEIADRLAELLRGNALSKNIPAICDKVRALAN